MIRFGARLAFAALAVVTLMPATAAQAMEPTGTISGHITKEPAGLVKVNLWSTAGASKGQVISDQEGNYTFPNVEPGDYKVQFDFQNRFQWAYQKLGFSTANVINVTAGASVVVDETLLQPGAVEVVATDAATGQLVNNYCAGISQDPTQCGAVNGVLRLNYFGEGPRSVYIKSSDGLHAKTVVNNVSVVLGQVTRLEVALEPRTAITTTVVDRQTGAPLADVCVAALPLNFGAVDDGTCNYGVNFTDSLGQVTLGELTPGEYTLLAVPSDEVHGVQWVGRNGGVGSQYSALKVQGLPGQLSTVPRIRLDPQASITGVIRSAATGEPVMYNGCASILPVRQGSFPLGLYRSCSDEEGRYTITNLGPYAWPLLFTHFYGDFTATWSGGASDRKVATPVQAGIGQPAVADASLSPLTPRIDIRTVYADGQPYFGYLSGEIYNAKTGDLVNEFSYVRTIEGLADQNVRIRYYADQPGGPSWHGGTDFATAKTVKLINGALVTVTITLPY